MGVLTKSGKSGRVQQLETEMDNCLFAITYFEEFNKKLLIERHKEREKDLEEINHERLFLIEKRRLNVLKNLKDEKEKYAGMFLEYFKLCGKLPEKRKSEEVGPEK